MSLQLLIFVFLMSSTRGNTCVWPDTWSPDCGLPACPDCDLITCVENLDQDDCPDGFYLQDKMMLGCCPACVRKDDFTNVNSISMSQHFSRDSDFRN